jgi:hypothetical protein
MSSVQWLTEILIILFNLIVNSQQYTDLVKINIFTMKITQLKLLFISYSDSTRVIKG